MKKERRQTAENLYMDLSKEKEGKEKSKSRDLSYRVSEDRPGDREQRTYIGIS